MYPITEKGNSSDLNPFNAAPEDLELRTLAPYSTVYVRTRHSDYRIFLLDPKTGYALIEGGRFFTESAEAIVIGSTSIDQMLKAGWIGLGLHMVLHAHGQSIITSTVQSIRVEREAPAQAQ